MLALTAGETICIIAALALHWGLSVFSLYRLFLLRPKQVAAVVWNVVIVAGILVGPTVFLIWFYATGKREILRKRRENWNFDRPAPEQPAVAPEDKPEKTGEEHFGQK